ncbi:MAG: TonB-dependent receptor, partial [Calditrichaeota bacterium]|nr:TonB-dependent receptor [Calditrichota bacterium]
MKRLFISVISAYCIFCQSLQLPSDSVPDIIYADSITVFADFIRSNRQHIEVNTLHAHPNHISELFDSHSALLASTYGGSGTLSELKINGSPANHSLVLMEGFRQNNFQNGSFNLSNSTGLNVSAYDIYVNGASSQFGSDAMAGALNILIGQTNDSFADSYASIGSYNRWQFENRIALKIRKWHVQLAQHVDQSDNYFPYFKNNRDLAYRNGADHQRSEYQAILQFQSENWYWKSLYKYNFNDSGVPGPKRNLTVPFQPGKVRQLDESGLLISKLRFHQNDSFLEAGFAINPQQLDYLSNHYENLQNSAYLNFSKQFGGHWFSQSKIDFITAELDGNTGLNRIKADRYLLALSQQFAWANSLRNPDIAIDLTFRHEWLDFDTNPLMLELIVKKMLWQSLYLSGRFATHFRQPTFNELYWPQAGNPNLNPEHGISRSIQLDWRENANSFHIEYLHHNYSDLIVWTTDNLSQLTVKNINRSFQSAWKLSGKYQLKPFSFQLEFLHQVYKQNEKNALNVIPNELTCSLTYEKPDFAASFSWNWTDHYYDFNSPNLYPQRNDLRLRFNYRFD